MVNRVVPRNDLDAAVEAMAAHIARAPLSTLMATKQLVSRAWELMGMRMHLQMSTDVMAVTAQTSDARAVRLAMLERGLRPRQHAEGGDDARPES
jgi:enoyl-CoA hydratase/carnithine racemase